MSESTLWWIVAAFFVSLELLSGSLYLLILAFGAAGAALCALLGQSQDVQFIVAAVVGGGGVLFWHRQLLKRGPIDTEGYTTTGLGQLDVGEEVSVAGWAPDGTAQVVYRGSAWMARHHGPHVPQTGPHRIRAIENCYLVLEPL
ncbi:MAG TPA: NfeD family protein [Aquabacterium sp.]|uniref:NfeD family protein n=1 Tax=Aquabacterium sp. TaxID=1872578 RepID=UPI002E3075B5|nr:NfeD family protein [Aquabacterium sp.]HEX5356688.1 NfeD family protein [Aquabacterium sp.]